METVEIIKLPTIGEPLSIKTRKQGRTAPMKEFMIDHLTHNRCQQTGVLKKRQRRSWRRK